MLGRDYRLTNKKDFEKVKKSGTLIQNKYFGMLVYYRNDKQPSRFGFVVSTGISKDATKRNKTKRALREAVRQSLSFTKKGHDVVFLAKQPIVRAYTQDIMQEVKKSLEKAKLNK